ncbi:MAG TPA: tetratricopeptide repeat protein, partial [Acidimicrobiales bacterium]
AEEGIRQCHLQNSGDPIASEGDEITVGEARDDMREALAHYNAGRFDRALEAFDLLYRSNQGGGAAQPRLALYVGLSLYHLERSADAIAWLQEAASHPGADDEVKEEAESHLRWAREVSGQLPEVNLGPLSVADAEAALDEASTLAWTDPPKGIATAYDVLQGSAGEFPSIRAKAQLVIGQALSAQRKWDEAIPWLEGALSEGDPSLAEQIDSALREARMGGQAAHSDDRPESDVQ